MRLVKGLLTRCTEVMELLAMAPSGVSEVAARLDMPKSAVHRLLQELCSLGWVQQMPDGRYRAALRFALLGRDVLRQTGLPDLAQPMLDRLARETRELVRLTVATPTGLAWLAFAQGATSGLVYQPEMAGPVVLHATANGKAYLASLDDEQVILRVSSVLGVVRPTARTIVSPDVLLTELRQVRVQGFAVANEEAEAGVAAVAVAIGAGPAAGTVSVAGPRIRMPDKRLPELAVLLQDVARALSSLRPFQPLETIACALN